MVFSSNIFLFIYLPAVLALYFLSPKRLRNAVLLFVSLFFYGWGEPKYLLLMLAVITVNYTGGLLIETRKKSAKLTLIISLAVNLILLGVFKYTSFVLKSVSGLFGGLGGMRIPEIVLPIGISFYIFQSMSYVIDVYWGRTEAQRSFINFGAYVALFPQLIAGPIVRYRDIADRLEQRSESFSGFASGVRLFTVGLAKKVLIANQMGAMWEALAGESGMLSAWAAMFAFTFQIYFDFSGYSDMACGLGRMFGFEFLKNFDYPYISSSITEFWRRWHISLSGWFREYVYIPLGGNRRGQARQLLNIAIVWALTGLWHGASWNYVLWGLYYALLLTLEKLFLLRACGRLPLMLRRAAVFLLVSFGWMLFKFEDLNMLGVFFSRMFSFSACSMHENNTMLAYMPVILAAALASTPAAAALQKKYPDSGILKAAGGICLALLFVLSASAIVAQSYNPFIYFRF